MVVEEEEGALVVAVGGAGARPDQHPQCLVGVVVGESPPRVYPWALTTAAAAVASAEAACSADWPPVCTNAGAGAVRVVLVGCSVPPEVPVVVVVAGVVRAGVEVVEAVELVCVPGLVRRRVAAGALETVTVFVPPPQPPSSAPPMTPRASAHAIGNARRIIVPLFRRRADTHLLANTAAQRGCAHGRGWLGFFGAHPRAHPHTQPHGRWASVPSDDPDRLDLVRPHPTP